MARPREFQTEDALERAMQVFWQHGYKDASLSDLLEGMKLTRGSLYKAFKDKKNLFLLVLDRYEAAQVDGAVSLLSDSRTGDGRARIKALFANLLSAVANGDQRGCLLCTAASGAAGEDAEIAAVVHRGMVKMLVAFEVALGEIPGIDPAQRDSLAKTLLTQYIGLRMLVRSRLPLGVLEQSVDGIDAILEGARA